MKLFLMQPYFFPYLGYFQLIAAVDDDYMQFIKNGWINRNHLFLDKIAAGITLPVERRHRVFSEDRADLCECYLISAGT